MKHFKRKSQGSGNSVPAYIVTFSDMVTLLLTFFVMLLSLSKVQDPEMFNQGRDSFVESIEFFGLGMLYGRKPRPEFGEVKVRYFIEEADEFYKERTIDAKEQGIREIFQRLIGNMKTMPPQMVAKSTDFTVTDIQFSPGEAILNEAAKGFLRRFVQDLPPSYGSDTMKFYVLGLAGDVKQEKEQWMLSAERAQAAADFLQDELNTRQSGRMSGASGRSVYSWGAGRGGDWTGADSMASAQSQILIGILRND